MQPNYYHQAYCEIAKWIYKDIMNDLDYCIIFHIMIITTTNLRKDRPASVHAPLVTGNNKLRGEEGCNDRCVATQFAHSKANWTMLAWIWGHLDALLQGLIAVHMCLIFNTLLVRIWRKWISTEFRHFAPYYVVCSPRLRGDWPRELQEESIFRFTLYTISSFDSKYLPSGKFSFDRIETMSEMDLILDWFLNTL